MNKKSFLFLLVVLASLHCNLQVSLAGSAMVPMYNVNVNQPLGDYIQTDFFIANVSTAAQNVTITLFNPDGTPLSGHPVRHRVGAVSNPFVSTSTNANGEVSVIVPGLNFFVLVLDPDTVQRYGHGIITGSTIAGTGAGFLTANVIIRDSNPTSTSNIYFQTITINGGNPF